MEHSTCCSAFRNGKKVLKAERSLRISKYNLVFSILSINSPNNSIIFFYCFTLKVLLTYRNTFNTTITCNQKPVHIADKIRIVQTGPVVLWIITLPIMILFISTMYQAFLCMHFSVWRCKSTARLCNWRAQVLDHLFFIVTPCGTNRTRPKLLYLSVHATSRNQRVIAGVIRKAFPLGTSCRLLPVRALVMQD